MAYSSATLAAFKSLRQELDRAEHRVETLMLPGEDHASCAWNQSRILVTEHQLIISMVNALAAHSDMGSSGELIKADGSERIECALREALQDERFKGWSRTTEYALAPREAAE